MAHIKRAWLLLLALAAPVTSSADAQCKSAALLSPGDHNDRLAFEGTSHDLIIHVPATYDGRTRVPLVVDLHGSHSDAAQQTLVSGFTAVADANNFILVAPTGYMGTWNGDIAYGAAYEQKLNDVGFIKALVDYVAGLASIDRTRVYATGLSNGGAMSNTLGCQATDVFAGIAPVADPLDIGLPTCMPTQPIAVIGFHGYHDEYVPYKGGPGEGPMLPTPFPSVPDTLRAWGGVMGCTADPEVVPIQGESKCEIYRMCGRAVQVGYCSIEGGHMLYWQEVLNVADYAWKFLSQFKLTLPDADGDGVNDRDDNCIRFANPDQTDVDGNCIGDVCECGSDLTCADDARGSKPDVAGAGGAAGAVGAGGATGAGATGGAAGAGGAGRSAAVGGEAVGGASGSAEQVAGAAATDSANHSEPMSSPRMPVETTSSTRRSGCSVGAATSDLLNVCVLGVYALLRRRKRLG